MDVMNYIVDNALVLIPALIIIGQIIKNIPSVPNWMIPLALLVPGVIGTMAIVGWDVPGAVQGILVTGAAVYGNQLWKQVLGASGGGGSGTGTIDEP
jgi:hypothetical protein